MFGQSSYWYPLRVLSSPRNVHATLHSTTRQKNKSEPAKRLDELRTGTVAGVFLIKNSSNTNEFKSCIVCGKLFKKWTMSKRPFATFCARCSVTVWARAWFTNKLIGTYLHQWPWSNFCYSQCSPEASLCCPFWIVWTTRQQSCWQLSSWKLSRQRRLPIRRLYCRSRKSRWICPKVSDTMRLTQQQ